MRRTGTVTIVPVLACTALFATAAEETVEQRGLAAIAQISRPLMEKSISAPISTANNG